MENIMGLIDRLVMLSSKLKQLLELIEDDTHSDDYKLKIIKETLQNLTRE